MLARSIGQRHQLQRDDVRFRLRGPVAGHGLLLHLYIPEGRLHSVPRQMVHLRVVGTSSGEEANHLEQEYHGSEEPHETAGSRAAHGEVDLSHHS